MKIDTEHLHFWMNAIRISNNPMRTLDAFWQGQIKSKEWLIENLRNNYTWDDNRPARVDIHGGWVGVLASMIFQSGLPVRYIYNVDIDPLCEHVATMMNKIEEQDGRFKHVTADMCSINITDNIIVINTSCEHITQEQYDTWLNNVPSNTTVVLQSNNYKIPEHVRIADTLDQFIEQSKLTTVTYSGTLQLPMYNRFMIIGRK